MSTTVAPPAAPKTGNKTGEREFSENIALYSLHRAFIDAFAKVDNIEQAIADAKALWERLGEMADNGHAYTPPTILGFGSDNAAGIASALMGRRPTTAVIRSKAVAAGKKLLPPKAKK